MADAFLSVAADRIATLMQQTVQNELNLVRGVEEEVESLSTELITIGKGLDDAERRRFKDDNVNYWMTRLEHMEHEIEDILDEWYYAIAENDDVAPPKQKKVCSFFIPSSSCLCFNEVVVRHHIATKIKSVKERLDKLSKERERYKFLESPPITDPSPNSERVQSTSFINSDEVYGRDSDTNVLVNKLIVSNNGSGQQSLHILSIVGAGGIGKTTLAQKVYNDDRVKDCFPSRIWICVSDPFDVAAIAKAIIEKVGAMSCPTTDQWDILLDRLTESIKGKKFLLVLDDVWSDDNYKWDPLKNSLKRGGAAGSVILVTTRKEDVPKMMRITENDIHRLKELSHKDCWDLLSHIALFGRNQEESTRLAGIGEKIAKKCKGLPLATKILGSLLLNKNTFEEWQNVLNSEIWEVKEAEEKLFPHLFLSYNELSPKVKRCFSYCAVFPKDSVIKVDDVIRKWMAQGYLGFNIENSGGDMELEGRKYFNILAMHSLFQDFKKDRMGEQIESFKLHDIVHDFAEFLRKNSSSRRVEDVGLKKTTCRVCSSKPLLVSSVKEYRSLFLQYLDEPLQNLCDCLGSLRALGLGSNIHGQRPESIPQGMENLIHLRWLYLSCSALHGEDTTTICKLYNLQFLCLSDCGLGEISREIRNLIHLRHLDLKGNDLREIPIEIWNLIQLRHLDLTANDLEEISMEIRNLIHLRHLDVSYNKNLKELPESLYDLRELRTLIVDECRSLVGLPEGTLDGLKNLEHLQNEDTEPCFRFPQGLAQLSGLRTLTKFYGGSGWNKLGWLKNLNSLSGYLDLYVRLSTDDLEIDVVEDAREAELRKKIHIEELWISFDQDTLEESYSSSRVRMDVIDALEPNPSLQQLLSFLPTKAQNFRVGSLPSTN